MKKLIKIEGMSCGHCQAKVEKALNGLDGVEAKVDLGKKIATVKLSKETPDVLLKKVIEDAGFQPISIEVKKGLFGK